MNKIRSLAMLVLVLSALNSLLVAATVQTENFVVTTNGNEVQTQAVADTCEHWRKELAAILFGVEYGKWPQRCRVMVTFTNSGDGGATQYQLIPGQAAVNFTGNWQGSYEAIIHDVTPHEIAHTVIATEMKCGIPRWLDEGIASFVESESHIFPSQKRMKSRAAAGRLFRLEYILTLRDYPREDIGLLYDQGQSMVQYLVARGGIPKLREYLLAGRDSGDWVNSLLSTYEFQNINELRDEWLNWAAGRDVTTYVAMRPPVSYQYDSARGGWIISECEDCQNGNCPPNNMVPVNPRPTTTKPTVTTPSRPVVDTSGITERITEIEKQLVVIREESKVPGPAGPAGPAGPQGPPGPAGADGVVDYDRLASEVIQRLPPAKLQISPTNTVELTFGSTAELPPIWVRTIDPRGRYTTPQQPAFLGQDLDIVLEPIGN